jgi:alkylresorcinol/alkylpyrone synthase
MTPPDLSPRVRAVGRALPPYYAEQSVLAENLRRMFAERHAGSRHPIVEHMETIHRGAQVGGRHLALPLAEYAHMGSFARRNELWTRFALDVAEQAVRDAIGRAGMTPDEIDHVFFVTVTGIAVPSIDARLVNRVGLRADVKRTPIFGLGCAAGAAGTARASDYLRAFPREVALLLSVELCSLTLQTDDCSVENVVASGLFGDGAAAVVIAGAERKEATGPRVLASRSMLYPGTEEALGWEVIDTGFKIVLSGRVPALAREHVRGDVDALLGSLGLSRGDVRHWIVHTGGPKVLSELEKSLELPADALDRSWSSLRRLGNLSSASVLFIMGDLLEGNDAQRGDYGLVIAMGPGFCSELVLLAW